MGVRTQQHLHHTKIAQHTQTTQHYKFLTQRKADPHKPKKLIPWEGQTRGIILEPIVDHSQHSSLAMTKAPAKLGADPSKTQ